MSWAWPERVHVHIDTGTVRVERRGGEPVTLEHPATLPLADVLARVDAALGRFAGRPWRLHVSLGEALCQPVAFNRPASVRRQREVQAIAHAAAAAAWGLPPAQAQELLCCVLDERRDGMAAAMMHGTRVMISDWALRHGGRLRSLKPRWAMEGRTSGLVRIDFVPSQAWRWIWGLGAVAVLAGAAHAGWQFQSLRALQRAQQAELDALQTEALARQAAAAKPPSDARAASEQAVARLQHWDWNRLYDTLEAPLPPPVRLVQLSVDAAAGDARLEYALADMGQAAQVSEALNSAAGGGVWRLEQIEVSPGGLGVRGVWRATGL